MMNNAQLPLLSLLQMADSAIPIGGYSHSYGLETWVQENELVNAEQVRSAISVLLANTIAPQNGIACSVAHQCFMENDNSRFRKLNEMLSASTWAREPLQASLQMGQRLARLALELGWSFEAGRRFEADGTSMPPGMDLHHCAVFGWLAASAGLGLIDGITAYLYNACCSMVSACVRLVPLGHTDGQKIIAGLHEDIAKVANNCVGKSEFEMQAFAPLHERACVLHESLYSRLFQS